MAGRRRPLRSIVALAGLLAAVATGAAAADRRFAVVVPATGNAFYDAVGQGCRARAAALTAVKCLYAGPGGEEKRNQGEIVAAMVADKVDGIAVSPALLTEVAPALAAAKAAGIPVVAFDADLPAASRRAFVGTDARDFGRALAGSLRRWKPNGGRYALLTGPADAPSLADRVAGVRDGLGPGWTEVDGSPATTTGEARDAVSQVERLFAVKPEIDAVISVGAWPLLAEDAWRDLVARNKERFDRARTVVVIADALPQEKRLVREGFGHVLVGQRPADMGARVIDVLEALSAGRRAPEVVYVGFDVLTRRDLVGRSD